MKTEKISKLRSLARDQDYKRVALVDSEGTRVVPFNGLKTSVSKQFDLIEKRLKVLPDGYYHIYMARSINTSNNPDKFLIAHGKVSDQQAPTVMSERVEIRESSERLTVSESMEMVRENAHLKAENESLLRRVNALRRKVRGLSDELYEAEEKLKGSSTSNYLKEQGPTFIAMAERFFSLREREIALSEKNISGSVQQKPRFRFVGTGNGNGAAKKMQSGSDEHIALIKKYYDAGEEDAMNDELDKLKEADPAKYAILIGQLQLEEDPEEED